MKQSRTVLILSLMACFLVMGCSSTKVTRVGVNKQIDLSGYWNDSDALLVSKEMIADCLARPWLSTFMMEEGRAPVVIVGNVINKTQEHINSDVFVKYLERELLNSGKINFVASPVEREQLRNEREDQQRGYTSEETIRAFGQERGADMMMIGSLNSVKDEVKGKFVMLYQANLELIDLTTNDKLWIGQKQIKKFTEKKRFSL